MISWSFCRYYSCASVSLPATNHTPLEMKRYFLAPALFLSLLLIGCGSTDQGSNQVQFTILQINDVYEIAPLQNGEVGGMARVATLRKELLAEDPNVITVLAGDFASPSLIGTLKHNGERIAGKQMVDAMNHVGMDYVTFGNHEFDLKQADLQKRLNESKFIWTVCNAFEMKDSVNHAPFEQNGVACPTYVIHEVNANGQTLKVGLIGVVLPFNKSDYVHYEDMISTMEATYNSIKDKCDVVIGITHQEIAQDIEMAKALPQIPLLIGGHDHTNMNKQEGPVAITKADANAKTAYVHTLTYDFNTNTCNVASELRHINKILDHDPVVDSVVNYWNSIAFAAMEEMGFEPEKVVTTLNEPMDGLEDHVRSKPTNLGQSIAQSMHAMFPDADVAVISGGSIRLDDYLEGSISEYDVLRTLPFGGGIGTCVMKGTELLTLLETGTVTNKGIGGYLQMDGAVKHNGEWLINGEQVVHDQEYTVVASDFLLAGKESNLEIFADYPNEAPDTLNGLTNDIREIYIAYMSQQ